MKYLILLLLLTFSLNAERYNLVNEELTLWTDDIYLTITEHTVSLIVSKGIVFSLESEENLLEVIKDKPLIFKTDNGLNIYIYKKGIIITVLYEYKGKLTKIFLIEGIEYTD